MISRFLIPAILACALCAPRPARAQKGHPPALLDINDAGAEELQRLPGIGPARAAAIVRIRERNGPFRCVEELRALPRLPEKVFAQIRPRVTVTPLTIDPGPIADENQTPPQSSRP